MLAGDFNTLAPGEVLDLARLPARLRAVTWLTGQPDPMEDHRADARGRLRGCVPDARPGRPRLHVSDLGPALAAGLRVHASGRCAAAPQRAVSCGRKAPTRPRTILPLEMSLETGRVGVALAIDCTAEAIEFMKFRSAFIASACAALVQILPGVASADTPSRLAAAVETLNEPVEGGRPRDSRRPAQEGVVRRRHPVAQVRRVHRRRRLRPRLRVVPHERAAGPRRRP